jgi:hypothetical protein
VVVSQPSSGPSSSRPESSRSRSRIVVTGGGSRSRNGRAGAFLLLGVRVDPGAVQRPHRVGVLFGTLSCSGLLGLQVGGDGVQSGVDLVEHRRLVDDRGLLDGFGTAALAQTLEDLLGGEQRVDLVVATLRVGLLGLVLRCRRCLCRTLDHPGEGGQVVSAVLLVDREVAGLLDADEHHGVHLMVVGHHDQSRDGGRQGPLGAYQVGGQTEAWGEVALGHHLVHLVVGELVVGIDGVTAAGGEDDPLDVVAESLLGRRVARWRPRPTDGRRGGS